MVVELKKIFTISNYLCEKFDNITIITLDKSARSKLNKKINFICPKNYFFKLWVEELSF